MKLRRFDYVIKGIESPTEFFSVLSLYVSVVFFNFLVALLEKILNTKILLVSMRTFTNSKNLCQKPILFLRLPICICHWSVFSKNHLSLTNGKIGFLNSHL